MLDDAQLRRVLEAALVALDEPLTVTRVATVLRCPAARVEQALREVAGEYARDDRGFVLRQVAGAWRLYAEPGCVSLIERLVTDGQSARLSQAALETLAVVAYRQPVSRGRVAAIRGVNVDGVMRTLQTRGLVEEAGTEGGATLFRTTGYFLERLGLDSLEQLPPIGPLLPDVADVAGLTSPDLPGSLRSRGPLPGRGSHGDGHDGGGQDGGGQDGGAVDSRAGQLDRSHAEVGG